MTAIRVVPQKFRFCLLKNKRQEFFFAPKVLSGGQTDRVLARRAVCTSDNQAGMSKQGESPDYECRRRLREHAVRSNLRQHTVRSNLLSRTLPTPPSIPWFLICEGQLRYILIINLFLKDFRRSL